MRSPDWPKVEELFHAAIERGAAEREKFLAEACRGNEELRREVLSLLACSSDAERMMQEPAARVATQKLAVVRGTRLGPYEVVELLGAGGMGEVYRARDTRLGREVAIKVLPDALRAEPDRLRRFEQEARAASALNHPNLLAVFDVGTHDGVPYVVSELLEGETLRERLRTGGLTPTKAIEFAVQIARGLSAAHEKGITHRDLKPENLFLTKDGRVKILDFGLAKLLEPRAGGEGGSEVPTLSQGTEPGAILGTVGYMSPEQVRGMPADHRSDIFSFAAVLYEMLSRRRAFLGENSPEVMTSILKEDPPDLSSSERNLPPALGRIVRRCLEKRPEDRFQCAHDLALALEALSVSPDSAPIGSEVVSPERRLAAASRLWAVLALLVGVGAGWLINSSRGGTGPTVTRFTIPLPALGAGALHLPTGRVVPFAISPDGQRLAYCAADDRGDTLLHLRELNAFDSKALPGTAGCNVPFFSPDGRWIAFQGGDGKVRKVSVLGGPPIDIGRPPEILTEAALWGKDDGIVFSSRVRWWRLPATGVEPQALPVNVGRDDVSPQDFLPGGKEVLASSRTPEGDFLEAVSLESGKRRRLAKARAGADGARVLPSGHLVYAEGGSLLAARFDRQHLQLLGSPAPVLDGVYTDHDWFPYVALSDTGTLVYAAAQPQRPSRLLWVDRTGRAEHVPGAEAFFWGWPRLSPDGTRVAATLQDGRGRDIWIFDLVRGARMRLTSEGENRFPVWTADGASVAFQRNVRTAEGIFRQPADGSAEAALLLERKERPVPRAFTPDGRGLVFVDHWPGAAKAEARIYTAESGLSVLRTGGLDPDPNRNDLAFSPDGRLLAFTSNESGRDEVYLQPYPGRGATTAVSTAGGFCPRWGPGGRELFFRSDDKVMVVDVETTPRLRLGKPRVLFERPERGVFDVSPDGRRFLMLAGEDAPRVTELRVIVNWTQELTRLVP